MGQARLSAALIVRDEEHFLEGCLRSLAGRVDEVVVVDTGSRDRSREIAVDLGARVVDFVWHDDFAAARNRSVDLAQGDWILYIDADERLVEFDRPAVEVQLGDPQHICYTVKFRPAAGFTRYREYRLFRKRPELRFSGSVHESLVPALEALCVPGGPRIGASPVTLDHHGYDGNLSRKHARNLPLLQTRLEKDPLHVYCWDQLGLTLLGLDDAAGAEAAWRHAVAIVAASRQRSLVDSLPYQHLAALLMDHGQDAGAVLAEGGHLFPDNHALTWLRGRWLVECGRFAEATPLFARLAAVDPERIEAGRLAFDVSIFGAQAHAALGLCTFRMGDFRASAEHYARAAALAPTDLEIRAKHAVAALRAKSAAA